MRGALVRPAPVRRLRLSLERDVSGQIAWLAVRLTLLAALIPLALYAWAVTHRIGYGYEFDWLEGGAVELVGRVVDGRSLYSAPTLSYVAYPYPPLFSWVAAAVAEVTGVGFLPLRIVSCASSLVAFLALWKLVVAATGDRVAGMVAVGLLAATYGLSGWWFDVGRLDSLFVALTLVALWLGRGAAGVRAGAVVGLVAFLACFTKQVAVLGLAPALGLMVVTHRRPGVAALLTLGLLLIASTLILDAVTGGWYRYYVFSELAGQPWNPMEWGAFWRVDLYAHLRPAGLLMLVALATALLTSVAGVVKSTPAGADSAGVEPRPGAWRRARVPVYAYELAAAAGLVAAAWISRLHTGGYVNVLMPAYAAVALLGGLAFASLRARGTLATLVAAGLVVVQLTGLIGSFKGAIPARGQSAAGAAVIAGLRALPGPVLVLAHPWYGTLAGKGSFAQEDALEEVLRSTAPGGAAHLKRDLADALNRYGIRAVVLDAPPPRWLSPPLRRDFRLAPAPLTRLALRDVGGVRTSPTLVYLRRPAS